MSTNVEMEVKHASHGFQNRFKIRPVSADEVGDIYVLESECYPKDEAASREMMVYRQKEAPDLLLAAFDKSQLAGFVCATRYHGRTLAEEAMSMHIPDGESVCIHSVVVRQEYRRQGLALRLLGEFVGKVRDEQQNVARILLICKSQLIPLYTRAGFVLNGRSEVVHGKDPWYELQMDIQR